MLIVFLAGYMREKREVLAQGRLKDWGPLLVIWALAMLVLLETRDLGGGLLYFGIFLAMLYVATRAHRVRRGRPRALPRRRRRRLEGHAARAGPRDDLAPSLDRAQGLLPALGRSPTLRQNCQSFQLVKSLYSIAQRAATAAPGSARGRSRTSSGTPIIPDLNTDFIYSALAQELGLIGVAALLLVYMIFVLRGMRIALLAQDGFSKLLAAGLTFGFALQTFIIVGGILRLIPLTGITLPFVSYGGSSVVANFLLLAGLLLVSNRANREALR